MPRKTGKSRRGLRLTRANIIGILLVVIGVSFYFTVVFVETLEWSDVQELLGGNVWQLIAIVAGIVLVALGGILIQRSAPDHDPHAHPTTEPDKHADTDTDADTDPVRSPADTPTRQSPAPPAARRRPANHSSPRSPVIDAPRTDQGDTTLLDEATDRPIAGEDIAAIDRYIDETRESLYSAKTVIKICCQNCGTLNDDNARFCDQCGRELTTESSSD